MKHKNLHCVKKKQTNKQKKQQINNKRKKKRKKYSLTNKTLHFPSFLLLCNAVIRVKDIKVVQFKRKLHFIIPGRKFFTT